MVSLEDLFTKPRKAARSYAELIPWFALVDSGIVLCQDGSLLAGFTFDGTDVEGKEDFESDNKINQLQTALRTLNDRITLWTVQERRFVSGYPRGDFANPVAEAIDRQWEKHCSYRRNAHIRQTMYIGFSYPSKTEALFENLQTEIQESNGQFFSSLGRVLKRRMSERSAIESVRGRLNSMVGEFEKILESFAAIVELNLGFRRLRDEHFLGELFSRANLASKPGPVSLQKLAYLNTSLSADTVIRRNDQLEFKGVSSSTFVAALSATSFPPAAYSGHIDQLMGVDCEYALVQCYKFLDRSTAEKAIQDAEQFFRNEVKSVMTKVFERMTEQETDKVNTGNLHLAEDAQQALVEMTAGDVSYGHYNMTILAMGKSGKEADDAADRIASTLRTNGFALLRERQGIISAMLTTTPGSSKATLRWKLASTANLADLAPIRTISNGESTHPLFSKMAGRDLPPLARFMTPHGIPYDYNPHELDLGHTAIIGGAGAGKTSLMTLFISQFQKYQPAQTFIFDKDHSLMVATLMLGGRHLDLGAKSGRKVGMNPVRVMMENGDDLRLRQWIEVLIAAGGATLTANDGQWIFQAIQGLRKSPPSSWRLSSIYSLIAGVSLELASKLAPYVDRTDHDDTGRGTYADYFDNDRDSFSLTNMVGMECGGILDMPQLASPFMDYAFYCIEQTLDGVTPTLIYIEEAWYMLSNPQFAAKVEDWLRTFRKKKAFVMFCTQSLDELARLENIGSFVTNIPSQIFLPAIKSSVLQQADLYRSVFGTTDAQLALLAMAIPKRDYLLVKPHVTRLVSTRMPPVLLAINEATSNAAHRKACLEASQAGGPDWQIRFLKESLNVTID